MSFLARLFGRAVSAPRPPRPSGLYQATVRRWVDGDTPDLDIHLAFGHVYYRSDCRVYGINAPELPTPQGVAATDHAKQLIPEGSTVTVTATTLDKYGRPLVRLQLADGSDFGDRMVADGFAVRFMV